MLNFTEIKEIVGGWVVQPGSMSVPDDPQNLEYQMIQDDVDNGAVVIPHVVPAPTYKELRAAEYNLKTTGEQFGMQYDDAKNSTTTWVDWQTEIKVRIPE